jgi:hypothetical protein
MKKASKNFFEMTFVTALTLTMIAACGPGKTRPATNKAKSMAHQQEQNTADANGQMQAPNVPFALNITDQQTLVALMQTALGEDAVNTLLNHAQGPLDEKVDFGLHLSHGVKSADSDTKQFSFLNFRSVLSNSVDKPMVLQFGTKKSKVTAVANDAGLELAAHFSVPASNEEGKTLNFVFDGFILHDEKVGDTYTGTISLSDDADVLIDQEHKKTKQIGTFSVPLDKVMDKENITALKQLKRATPAPAAEAPDKSLQ